jgi:aspartate aminotransferase
MKPSEEMVKAFKRRRELILQEVKQIPNWVCNNPEGAFYLFPDVSYYFGKSFEGKTINTATDLCMYLLHNAHVSMVTGEAFGAPQCIRISYATSDEKIVEAMRRIKKALDMLN